MGVAVIMVYAVIELNIAQIFDVIWVISNREFRFLFYSHGLNLKLGTY